MNGEVVDTEWAIQYLAVGFGMRPRYEDCDIFNKFTCYWKEPIEEWGEKILKDKYIMEHARRKYGKTVRLVKRVTRIYDSKSENAEQKEARRLIRFVAQNIAKHRESGDAPWKFSVSGEVLRKFKERAEVWLKKFGG